MSDTTVVDGAASSVAASTPAAPPQASEAQGSAPAPVDTTANGQEKPQGTEPDRQTRRDSRAFATLRRENRELSRQLGYLQAQFEANRPPPQGQTEGDQPPRQQRQPAPDLTHARRNDEANDVLTERLEEAGEDIAGFEQVMEKLTGRDFPGTVVMRDFLLESEKPGQMAKWLTDNPREARRISLLSDVGQWRALERAEGKLSRPAPKTTQAPPPVPTVGGRSAPDFDPDKASMDEFAANWKAKRGIKD